MDPVPALIKFFSEDYLLWHFFVCSFYTKIERKKYSNPFLQYIRAAYFCLGRMCFCEVPGLALILFFREEIFFIMHYTHNFLLGIRIRLWCFFCSGSQAGAGREEVWGFRAIHAANHFLWCWGDLLSFFYSFIYLCNFFIFFAVMSWGVQILYATNHLLWC